MLKYIIVAILLIAFVWIKYKLRDGQIKKAGKVGEEFALQSLKKIVAGSGAAIYNNIRLPLYDKTTEVDFLIVTSQGILCIENKHVVGTIKGNSSDKYWKQIKKYEKKKMYNPMMQNEGHIKCLNYHLNKQRKNIRVDGYIIFSNEKAKLHINMSNVGTLEDFRRFYKKYVDKSKSQINVKEVCKIVDNIKI